MNHSEVGFHLRRRFNLLLSFERLENSILWVELKSAREALNDSFSCTFTVAKKGCVGPLMMMEHYVKIGRLCLLAWPFNFVSFEGAATIGQMSVGQMTVGKKVEECNAGVGLCQGWIWAFEIGAMTIL